MQIQIPKTLILQTENLQLRIPTLEDIPFIFSATRYKGFNEGMLWEPPEQEEDCIEPYHRSIKAWEEAGGYAFSIDQSSTGEFIGRISIRKTEKANIWNVGFWTHPTHQGKGIMTEALQGIVRFGFEQLDATQIEAAYAVWNKASEKVLQRNGFQFLRLIEKGFKKKGIWVKENEVAISLLDWNNNLKSS